MRAAKRVNSCKLRQSPRFCHFSANLRGGYAGRGSTPAPHLRDIRRRARIFNSAVGGPAEEGLANLQVCHLALKDPIYRERSDRSLYKTAGHLRPAACSLPLNMVSFQRGSGGAFSFPKEKAPRHLTSPDRSPPEHKYDFFGWRCGGGNFFSQRNPPPPPLSVFPRRHSVTRSRKRSEMHHRPATPTSA